MRCERSSIPALIMCWERRIGCRLYWFLGPYDPVKEITRRLYPNDQPEARCLPGVGSICAAAVEACVDGSRVARTF